jgi:hypothetical protein
VCGGGSPADRPPNLPPPVPQASPAPSAGPFESASTSSSLLSSQSALSLSDLSSGDAERCAPAARAAAASPGPDAPLLSDALIDLLSREEAAVQEVRPPRAARAPLPTAGAAAGSRAQTPGTGPPTRRAAAPAARPARPRRARVPPAAAAGRRGLRGPPPPPGRPAPAPNHPQPPAPPAPHPLGPRPQKRAAPPAPGPALSGAERANLVNWVTASAGQLGLGDDVLFSAVACLDALRLPPEAPHALICAAACLWVASKWAHGARAPPASAIVAALPACGCGGCGGGQHGGAAAARRRLLAAEAEVLRAFDYGAGLFSRPTVETFLRAALLQMRAAAAAAGAAPAAGEPGATGGALPALCMLLAEQSLLESQLLAFRPSVVAAACVAFAHALLGRPLPGAALAGAAACGVGAGAAEEVSRAADVLRAVHAAVSAAAAAGNPYACSLRWLRLEPSALLVAPITGASDARLAPLAAAAAPAAAPARAGGGAAPWLWVLPAAA